jgi:hypothetical protein
LVKSSNTMELAKTLKSIEDFRVDCTFYDHPSGSTKINTNEHTRRVITTPMLPWTYPSYKSTPVLPWTHPSHRSNWSCSTPLHTSTMQSSLLCLHTSHAKYGLCIHPTSIQIPFKVHYTSPPLKQVIVLNDKVRIISSKIHFPYSSGLLFKIIFPLYQKYFGMIYSIDFGYPLQKSSPS